MKKTYTKPQFMVEQFALTQQIASCAYLKIGFGDSACVLNNPDASDALVPGYYESVYSLALANYFADGYCAKVPEFSKDNDLLCYHTMTNMAFTS